MITVIITTATSRHQKKNMAIYYPQYQKSGLKALFKRSRLKAQFERPELRAQFKKSSSEAWFRDLNLIKGLDRVRNLEQRLNIRKLLQKDKQQNNFLQHLIVFSLIINLHLCLAQKIFGRSINLAIKLSIYLSSILLFLLHPV